jgi:hypothetical protein
MPVIKSCHIIRNTINDKKNNNSTLNLNKQSNQNISNHKNDGQRIEYQINSQQKNNVKKNKNNNEDNDNPNNTRQNTYNNKIISNKNNIPNKEIKNETSNQSKNNTNNEVKKINKQHNYCNSLTTTTKHRAKRYLTYNKIDNLVFVKKEERPNDTNQINNNENIENETHSTNERYIENIDEEIQEQKKETIFEEKNNIEDTKSNNCIITSNKVKTSFKQIIENIKWVHDAENYGIKIIFTINKQNLTCPGYTIFFNNERDKFLTNVVSKEINGDLIRSISYNELENKIIKFKIVDYYTQKISFIVQEITVDFKNIQY